MNREELLKEIKNRLVSVYHNRLKGVILYGSEARDDADPNSDIDILVLLTGPVSRLKEHRTIMSNIYDLVLEVERPIHARPTDVAVYEAADYPLYKSIKQEGIIA